MILQVLLFYPLDAVLAQVLAMVLCLRLSAPSQVGCSVETATRIDPVFAWRLSSIYPTR